MAPTRAVLANIVQTTRSWPPLKEGCQNTGDHVFCAQTCFLFSPTSTLPFCWELHQRGGPKNKVPLAFANKSANWFNQPASPPLRVKRGLRPAGPHLQNPPHVFFDFHFGFIGAPRQVVNSWWFGLVVWGFEPLVLVEGKSGTPPLPAPASTPPIQATN